MPKRKCSFTEDLQKELAFLGKSKSDSEVNCTQRNITFSVSHGRRSYIKDHMKSGRHKKAVEGLASKGLYSAAPSTSGSSRSSVRKQKQLPVPQRQQHQHSSQLRVQNRALF